MSRASTERDEALGVMRAAVLEDLFKPTEVKLLLLEALKRMTVTEMEEMVRTNTSYEGLLHVEVML
jgi:hypothetical protein